jgi:hypothetical protein
LIGKVRTLGRRLLILLAALVPTVVGFVPPAQALGGAACLISGTITFSRPAGATTGETGTWNIGPGQITCNGVIKGFRIFGSGPFTGSGSYEALPVAGGPCLQHIGTGMVDYVMRSGAMVWHMQEAQRFVLAAAGEIATPTLRGPAKLVPPYEGDCVTKPVTRAFFAAEVVMVNHHGTFLPLPERDY